MFGRLSAIDVSATGMAAESLRMQVAANNIANANTTRSENGEPYRRQNVIFAAAMENNDAQFGGVRVVGVQPDQTPFEWVHNPSHPHADADGNVLLSNVKIPNELVDLMTASRSYEANLRSVTLYKEMVEETLSLLNGGR
ncbi:MAG: flagellar basal body rod protein FlgC [Planctomycetota bacterium]